MIFTKKLIEIFENKTEELKEFFEMNSQLKKFKK